MPDRSAELTTKPTTCIFSHIVYYPLMHTAHQRILLEILPIPDDTQPCALYQHPLRLAPPFYIFQLLSDTEDETYIQKEGQ